MFSARSVFTIRIFLLGLAYFMLMPLISSSNDLQNGLQRLDSEGAEWNSDLIVFTESHYQNRYTVSAPFYFLGHLIAVQATIDQMTGYFIIDTGSQRLVLNSVHFSGQQRRGVSSTGSTGRIRIEEQRYVRDLTLEKFKLPSLRADIIDLGHIERSKNVRILGVIGYDIYKDYELFLDYQFRKLVLTKVDKKGRRLDPLSIPEIPTDSLQIHRRKHSLNVKGSIADQSLSFSLDTGAELNLLDRNVDPRVLENFEIIRRVRMIGMGEESIETLAGKLSGLHCGPPHYRGMRTLLTSTDYIQESSGLSVDGVLGFPFFFMKRFSINVKKKKLYFYKTEPTGP